MEVPSRSVHSVKQVQQRFARHLGKRLLFCVLVGGRYFHNVVVGRLFSYLKVAIDGYDFYWRCAVFLVFVVLDLPKRIDKLRSGGGEIELQPIHT